MKLSASCLVSIWPTVVASPLNASFTSYGASVRSLGIGSPGDHPSSTPEPLADRDPEALHRVAEVEGPRDQSVEDLRERLPL